jgi:hypothetical protein
VPLSMIASIFGLKYVDIMVEHSLDAMVWCS